MANYIIGIDQKYLKNIFFSDEETDKKYIKL